MSAVKLNFSGEGGDDVELSWEHDLEPEQIQCYRYGEYDDGYQRPMQPHLIEKIVSEYDPLAHGAKLVARRNDGSLWIVDGQQRLEAEKKLGHTKVSALVFDSDGPLMEAMIYNKVNGNRKGLSAIDKFWSRVNGGDKKSAALLVVVQSSGLEITKRSKGGSKWPMVNCVAEIESIYCNGALGPFILKQSLETIRESWGEDPIKREKCLDRIVIKGVAKFLSIVNKHKLRKFSLEILVTCLKLKMPEELSKTNITAAGYPSNARGSYIAYQVLTWYNKEAQPKNKLPRKFFRIKDV